MEHALRKKTAPKQCPLGTVWKNGALFSKLALRRVFLDIFRCVFLRGYYCLGKRFVKVLTQDFVLLNGVIAFVITHSHA